MGDRTKIEWTRGDDGALGATWNPVRGCSRVSEGCRHCYAERVARRFSGPGQPYEGLADKNGWTRVVRLVPEHLADPLRWKRPRRVFVNSMSDLFHEHLSNEDISAVFGVMAAAPKHVYQILTKRARRMREWFAHIGALQVDSWTECHAAALALDLDGYIHGHSNEAIGRPWPLPNVWLGVSVEDQATADERIPDLLATPAAVRFVSYEPALGAVNLSRWMAPATCVHCGHAEMEHGYGRSVGCQHGDGSEANPLCGCRKMRGEWSHEFGDPMTHHPDPALDWVIIGGESGPGARPFDLAWARSVIAQCKAAGVACFVKQLGARPWVNGQPVGLPIYDRKGGDPSEWPEDLCVREFPEVGP